jgi:hypothetical protein
MCDKCRQLENDIQRYQQRLGLGIDPQTMAIQRFRKLVAVGLDPQTIGRVDRAIKEFAQEKPEFVH